MGFFMLWIATQDNKSLMNVKEVTVDGKKIARRYRQYFFGSLE